MDEKDCQRLLTLLQTIYPKTTKTGPNTLAAWSLVFSPYDYEDVKTAAITYARENTFFPAPAELLEYLPAPAQEQPTPAEGGKPRRMQQKVWDWWQAREAARRAAGLSSILEARAAGMTTKDYIDLCRERGIE